MLRRFMTSKTSSPRLRRLSCTAWLSSLGESAGIPAPSSPRRAPILVTMAVRWRALSLGQMITVDRRTENTDPKFRQSCPAANRALVVTNNLIPACAGPLIG